MRLHGPADNPDGRTYWIVGRFARKDAKRRTADFVDTAFHDLGGVILNEVKHESLSDRLDWRCATEQFK